MARTAPRRHSPTRLLQLVHVVKIAARRAEVAVWTGPRQFDFLLKPLPASHSMRLYSLARFGMTLVVFSVAMTQQEINV